MNNRKKLIVAGTAAAIIIALVVTLIFVIRKNTPSKDVMELTEYFALNGNEAMIVFNDGFYEKKALYFDGQIYIDYETVKEKFNNRFYWDNTENLLLYTNAVSVIRTQAGSSDYYVNKSKSSLPYQIVKTQGNEVYIALDYVGRYSNITYNVYEEPVRVVINYEWGNDYLYYTVKDDTQVRAGDSIKSDILKQVKAGERLRYLESNEDINNKFIQVITEDGIIGFVRTKNVDSGQYETLTSAYEEEQYAHITKDYIINMVFHQVFDDSGNDNLLNALDSTKGVTTICPTWYRIADDEGNITSIASEKYVERAHNAGVEVWALVGDVDNEVDLSKILTVTSKREKLINELISNAIKLNLDGLNIDFEKVPRDNGEDFIQFLRELSVKCRNNGIILSVDNYVPTEYTAYYNRTEQAKVVDYIVVMAYDEHYAGSEEAGSVSSIGFVQGGIDNTIKEVPKEQVIIAIPFYTRLWEETTKENGTKELNSSAYGMQSARNLLKDYDVNPKWDDTLKQYYAEFKDKNEAGEEVNYKIWLEEEKSVEAKMKAVSDAETAGVAEWKLGIESDSVWDIILKYVN